MPDLPPLPKGASLDAPLPSGATMDSLPPLPNGAKLDQAPNDSGFRTLPGSSFPTRQIDLGNGKSSEQRQDGLVFFGPQQGNTGKPGWFNAQGLRGGDTPGKGTSLNDSAINEMMLKNREIQGKSTLGQMTPPPVAGMTQGVIDTVSAPAQLITHALGSNAMDAPVNAIEQNYQQNMMPSSGGRVVGQIMPLAATLGASSPGTATQVLTTAQKIKAALAGILKPTATGMVAAPTLTPETNIQSDADYWARKQAEAKTGALVGGALGTAGQVIGGVASKLAQPMAPEAQAIQDLGDKFGVRTLAPDLAPPGGMAKAAVLAESVPGSGMVNQRLAQQAEAQAAAQKLLDQYGITGDASTKIQQGLKNQLATGKGNANAAYDLVGKLSEGKGDVPLDQTLNAIQAAKSAESSAVVPDQGLVGLLDKMQSRLTDPKAGVDLSYTGVRGLRSDLGNMISDYYKGTNAATGSKGVQVLQGMKGALEGDLANFTNQNGPDIAQAAKQADSIYKSQVVPFKDQVIRTALKNSEPDRIYNAVVAQGPDRAQKFYNTLDSDGQAAVRSQMVQNAMDAATSGAQPFSPAKFAQSLEKIGDSTGVFFKGQDKMELDGLTNLMRHVQRSGQVGENPTNGQRAVQMLIAGEGGGAVLGAMAGHPAALVPAAASVVTGNALTRLFASNVGKRLLLSASSATPGSTVMENLVEKDLPRILSPSAASNVRPLIPTLPKAASTGQDNQVAQTEPK